VATKVWTTQTESGTVMSRSRSSVGQIVLADNPLGTLSIDALTSLSKVWHDEDGFHAATETDIGKIVLTPAGGDPQVLDLPTPGEPVEVPGLATISLGKAKKSVTAEGARAKAEVLRINATATQSRVRVGHTLAQMDGGIKSGIFSGFGAALRAEAADSSIQTGRTPFQPMDCQGTGGETEVRDTAGLNLGDQIVVGAVETRQSAQQTMQRASGFEESQVAEINIGDGALVVKGIVGRVNVKRSGDNLAKLSRNIKGTTIGSITANGEPQTFPDTEPLVIDGVASIERNVKKKIKGGLALTALRITLLDGSGAVIDLGLAKLQVQKSGL
jgi:hypothetical protein